MSRAAAMALVALAACAAEAKGASWYSQIDNDIVFETDRWYTSGFRLARLERESASRWTEWGIAQELYNPDLKRSDPVDRAYAGRLLASRAWHDLAPGFHRTLELRLGVRGPAALGRQSQEFIHRVIPGPDTDWSRQLPNRIDAQAVGVHTHEWKRTAFHYGAVLGSQVTFAHAGAELRTGGPQAIDSATLRFAATPPAARDGAHGWSGFVGASVRFVARNTLLQRHGSVPWQALGRKDAVVRSAAGVAWSVPYGAITFAIVQDTREFAGQRRNQRYGVLGIRLDFL